MTTEFVTQSGLVARQSWSGNTIDFFYDAQQRPYAMIYKPAGGTSATYYYLTNLQGDVIALLDESGSVVAEYEYGAWGDIRSITDSSGAQVTSSTHIASINPLRYRGYYYDTETGFYYLQSRYYDPVIKRFINADAAEYSALSALSLYDTNLFAYCRNNPVNYGDDGGCSPYGVLSLLDYAFIHTSVQVNCCVKFGWEMEIQVRTGTQKGRLDLYDAGKNEYYEVKSARAAQRKTTAAQMKRYDNSTVDYNGCEPKRGKTYVSGTLQYGFWDIIYSQDKAGLITYAPELNETRVKRYVQQELKSVVLLMSALLPLIAKIPVPLVA